MISPADVMVVIPVFALGAQMERAAGLAYVRARLAEAGLSDIVGAGECNGPSWAKGAAINRAVADRVASGTAKPWVWIHDADVVLPFAEVLADVRPEAEAVQPFSRIIRLDQAQTAAYMRDGRAKVQAGALVCDTFGGGSVLMKIDTFLRVRGFDERFYGWGGEDVEFGERVETLAGAPQVIQRRGVHLWHPPVPKASRVSVRDHNQAILAASREGLGRDPGRWMALGVESSIPAAPEPPASRPGTWLPLTATVGTGLPAEPRLVVACVCKMSRRYTPEVVKWLRRQVAARLKFPHRFVCLTDRPELVPGGIALRHNWPGYWSKLELFRPDLFTPGDLVMYLDLDTVLVGDVPMPEIPEPGDLSMVVFGTAWWTHYGSGVMVWRAPLTEPYEAFAARATEAIAWFPSDQEFIMPAVFRAGGRIRKFRGAEVQPHNGTAAIPEKRPAGPVWCAAGSGLKPWEVQRSWIPPLRLPAIQPGIGLVVAAFGPEAGPMVEAGVAGLARLQGLSPWPAGAVLVELAASGKTRFPGWRGDRLVLTEERRHADLWQKEALWNIGAKRLLAANPTITKLVFVDADTSPADGEEDWLAVVADVLDRCDIVHPWTVVRESDGHDGAWMSYSAQRAAGMRSCQSGQGFTVAMTKKWFLASGGWPAFAVAGSGDAMAVIMWEAERGHADIYRGCSSMEILARNYHGPKVTYGYMGGSMVHQWHGDRTGPNQTRDYCTRHAVWDLVDGSAGIVYMDENGLLAWHDEPLARAVRRVTQKRLKTRPEVIPAFILACQEENIRDPMGAREYIPETRHGRPRDEL